MFGSGFGNQSTSSLFGTTATTTSQPFGRFGSFGTTTTTSTSGFGGFGTTTFGSSLNKPLFGATTTQSTTTGLFGNLQAAQPSAAPQTTPANVISLMAAAITTPQIFHDERDAIIAKWNQLQAFWGIGKGFYSQNGAVDFTPENPFCRFKAVGYSCIPQSKNEDGLVSLTIAQAYEDVRKVQQQFLDELHKIIGGQSTLSICFQGLKPLPDNKTELIIYLLERPTSGPARKVPATDLVSAFSQTNIKNQLMSRLKVQDVFCKTEMTRDQLQIYLDTPPAGIDPLLWQQAKLDNPSPDKLLPTAIIGFSKLNARLKHQEQQTKLHQNQLDVMAEEFSQSRIKLTNMMCKLEEYKHKQLELGHLLLKIIAKQEVTRKLGYTIQADEEQLRCQLDAIETDLNHPTQFKGRLNELMSQMRLHYQVSSTRPEVSYSLDPTVQSEIMQLLQNQQEGLHYLMSIIREDMGHLKLIEDGLKVNSVK